jgi:hypothetical protein
MTLFLGLAVWQQYQIRRKRSQEFDHQSVRLLLSMLAVAFLGIVIFVAYVFGPQTGC